MKKNALINSVQRILFFMQDVLSAIKLCVIDIF